MVKPRGKIIRTNTPKPAETGVLGMPEVEISAWCRDPDALYPPEQVHLMIRIPGLEMPLIMRFKSPDTLGFLIEELTRYRRTVWPKSEKVQGE